MKKDMFIDTQLSSKYIYSSITDILIYRRFQNGVSKQLFYETPKCETQKGV
jgi:hypothetical protein